MPHLRYPGSSRRCWARSFIGFNCGFVVSALSSEVLPLRVARLEARESTSCSGAIFGFVYTRIGRRPLSSYEYINDSSPGPFFDSSSGACRIIPLGLSVACGMRHILVAGSHDPGIAQRRSGQRCYSLVERRRAAWLGPGVSVVPGEWSNPSDCFRAKF